MKFWFITLMNSTNWILSHSNQSLLHLIVHSHPLVARLPNSIIILSLIIDFSYSLRNFICKGASPTHVSFQKFILDLELTSYSMFWSNHLLSSFSPLTSLKYFQYLYYFLVFSFKPLLDPFFDSRISFHNPWYFIPRLHFYLANNVFFNSSMSLISIPPSCLGFT